MTDTITKGQFRRYDHIERLDHDEVAGLLLGDCYVFPKIDGTNASAWLDKDGNVCGGSRNRHLTLEADNAGFLAWLLSDDEKAVAVREALMNEPSLVLYGEWLVPHTVQNYRHEAWRRFYVFDAFDTEAGCYLPFDAYKELIPGVDVIEPLCIIRDPSTAQLETKVATNTYLMQDGAGPGEGIVVKNYAWRNQYGRQPWGKIVRNEFKEKNRTAFGTPVMHGEFTVEQAIVEKYCTPEFVGKTRAKVVLAVANEKGIDISEPNAVRTVESTHRGKVIPQFLGRLWHDFVTENIWSFLQDHKACAIDFGRTNGLLTRKAKELAQDLF